MQTTKATLTRVSATGLPSVLSQIVVDYGCIDPKIARFADNPFYLSYQLTDGDDVWGIQYRWRSEWRIYVMFYPPRQREVSSGWYLLHPISLVKLLADDDVTQSHIIDPLVAFIAGIHHIAVPTLTHDAWAKACLDHLFTGLRNELLAATKTLKT